MIKPILPFREQASENSAFSHKQSLPKSITQGLLHAMAVLRMEMQLSTGASALDTLAVETSAPRVASRVAFGRIVLDRAMRTVTADGMPVNLSVAEFETLAVLISHRNVPMTREAVASRLVGSGLSVMPRMVDVHVCRIRQKLAPVGLDSTVVTVWGRGYLVGTLPEEDRAPLEPHGGGCVADLLTA